MDGTTAYVNRKIISLTIQFIKIDQIFNYGILLPRFLTDVTGIKIPFAWSFPSVTIKVTFMHSNHADRKKFFVSGREAGGILMQIGKTGSDTDTFEGGFLFILLAGVLWGTCGTAQSLAPAGWDPLVLADLRILLGGVSLLLLVAARNGPGRLLHGWPPVVTLGAAVAMAAMQLFFFSAMRITGVAVGTMVAVGGVPIMSGVAGWFVLKETLDRRWFCSAALAVLGIILLSWKSEGLQVRPLGVLLALLASTAGTTMNLLVKRIRAERGSLETMGVVLFIGGLMASPLLFLRETAWLFNPRGIAVVLHLGLFTGAAAYALFAAGLRMTPLSRVGILMLTEPLTAFLLGVFLLGEHLSSLMLVGAVLLLVSVLLLSLPARR